MNPLADFAQRIANLESKVSNILQEGIITKVRESDNLVDIEVRGVQMVKVPYLTWRTGDGKSYWLPDPGESGMLLCADGQAGNAVFLPMLNTSANPAPLADTSKFRQDFGNKLVIDVDNGIDSIVSSDAFGVFHVAKIRNRDAKHELKNTDDVTRTTEHDKIKDEVETAHIEITASSIKVVVGLTELEVSSTEIKGSIAGLGKILVNAALVNINGATFAAGTTNLAPTAPTITYPPVPIT